jgi:hypothetical protein
MVAALLMLGVTLLGVTTLWMIEHATHRGFGGWRLLVPLAAGQYIREYWDDVHWIAMARVFGGVLVALGIGVAIAQNPALLSQPSLAWQGTTNSPTYGSTEAGVSEFLEMEHKALLAMGNGNDHDLSGKLHGKPFAYQRVELIDGVLDVRQGTDFLPTMDVRILVNLDPSGMTDRRSFYVQPTDTNPPEVYLSWQGKNGQMETRIIKHGYSLELQLAPLTAYRLNGYMQLILPGKPESYLSGNFIAETNNLRYINGAVDIGYDDPDTLKYVARDYLSGQFRQGAVRNIVLSDTAMDVDNGTGSVTARVLLSNDQLEEHQLKLQRDDLGWQVVPGSDQITVLRQASTPDASASSNVSAAAPKIPAPRSVSPSDLVAYRGNTVTLTRADGSTESGIIRGYDKHGLQVEEQIGGGSVQYHLDVATITRIVLSNGQILLLPAGQKQDQEKAATVMPPVSAPRTENEPAQVSAAAQTSDTSAPSGKASSVPATATPQASSKATGFAAYQKWLNHEVVIVGADGRSRSGTLSGVAPSQLTLTVTMGAGSMQFFYKPDDVQSVSPLKN